MSLPRKSRRPGPALTLRGEERDAALRASRGTRPLALRVPSGLLFVMYAVAMTDHELAPSPSPDQRYPEEQLIWDRLNGEDSQLTKSEQEKLRRRVRAAAAGLRLRERSKGRTVSKLQRDAFLTMVGMGLNVRLAAQALGVAAATFYGLRQRDAEFARAWADAKEMALEEVETRLVDIAMAGDPGDASMAQVRAAEILGRWNRRSEQRNVQVPTVELETTGDDGRPRIIRVSNSTPLPD